MRSIFSTIVLLLCAYSLHAQIAGEPMGQPAPDPAMKMPDDETIRIIKQQALHGQWNFFYQQAVSQGELREAFRKLEAPETGYGFGVEGGYYFDPIPLAIGGELGVYFNGEDGKALRANDFCNTRINVSASNMQIPILLHVRFQPNIESWLFPYVEGVSGLTIYSSTVTTEEICRGDTIVDRVGRLPVVWSYGLGAGLAIKIADMITLPNELRRTLIDIRFRYLWGTSTGIPNAVLDGGNGRGFSIIEEPVESPRVVTFRVGFIFQF